MKKAQVPLLFLLLVLCLSWQTGYQFQICKFSLLTSSIRTKTFNSASLAVTASLTPSLQPLQYINLESIASYIFETSQDAVVSALLPVDQQDALVIFISEGISGFLGGIAARSAASLNGNRNNRESSLVSAESSGAYFGTIGALRSLAQLAGLSSIFVNLLSLVFASLLSEAIKIRNRSLTTIQTRVGKGPTMYELMKFKNPSMLDLMKFAKDEEKTVLAPRMKIMGSMTEVEILSDLTKWLMISLLLPLKVSLEDALLVGILSGIAAQTVRESKDQELSNELRKESRRKRKLLNQFILSERSPSRGDRLRETLDLFLKQRPTKALRRLLRPSLSPLPPPPSSPAIEPALEAEGVDFAATRFARAAIEGAAQLVTYEASRRYVMEVSPYFQHLEDLSSLVQQHS